MTAAELARTEALRYYGGPAVREWHHPDHRPGRPQTVDNAGLSVDAWRLLTDIHHAERVRQRAGPAVTQVSPRPVTQVSPQPVERGVR